MKKLLCAVVLLTATGALADDTMQKAGKQVDKATSDTVDASKKAANDAAKSTKKGVSSGAAATNKAASKSADAVKKTTDAVAPAK
jgi:hypothetical protein